MARKIPERIREGVSLAELLELFPDDRTAEDWFARIRWPDGPVCPYCESDNILVRSEEKRGIQPYHCRSCGRHFSVKVGTLMHASRYGCRVWLLAAYCMTAAASPEGISSARMRRALGIAESGAWMLAHKIREAHDERGDDRRGRV